VKRAAIRSAAANLDTALIREAGIFLDRALFPLLVGIERKGPIGVGELADLVSREYTTVSRQVAKLESSDNRKLWLPRGSVIEVRSPFV